MESPAQVTPPGELSQPAHSVSPSPFADSLSCPTTFGGNSFSLPGSFDPTIASINDSTLTKEPQTQKFTFGIPSTFQGHSLEDDNPGDSDPADSGPADITNCVLNALSPIAPGVSPKRGCPSKGTHEHIEQLYEEMDKLVSIAAVELGITQQQVLSYGPNVMSSKWECMNNVDASENFLSTKVTKGAYYGFEGTHCIVGRNVDTDGDLTCLINSTAAEGKDYLSHWAIKPVSEAACGGSESGADHEVSETEKDNITDDAGASMGATLKWKGLRGILVTHGLHCLNWPYNIEFPTESLAPGAKAIGIKELSKQKAVDFSQRIKDENGLCIVKGNSMYS
ncbi:hypothetical protein BDQ17DRAFT_1324212 [Cyathus striatus]|nr:hypothetical protein BDQ17DRAFT_1324212 [Cyathus striatus]